MPKRHLAIALVGAFCIALVGFYSSTVHLPFLVNFVLSTSLGWIQPRKGWILALLQVVCIGLFHFALASSNWVSSTHTNIAQFTALLAFFPTLTGSFMGGFVKRAL